MELLAFINPFALIGLILVCAAIKETVCDMRDWIRRK